MVDNDNWYFDNVSEDIVYGDIRTGGTWLEMTRRIKKASIIRKMANDKTIITDTLPQTLGNAIDYYRDDR